MLKLIGKYKKTAVTLAVALAGVAGFTIGPDVAQAITDVASAISEIAGSITAE